MSTSASSNDHRRTPVTSLPPDALASLKAGHGLLRAGDVMALIGLRSRTSLYKLVQTGDLPQPVKLRPGGRASAWRAADVAAFIESREVDPLARPVKPSPLPPSADARRGTHAPPKPVKRAPCRNSVKTTEAGGPRGFDAGKKVKERKRHIAVDTSGLPIECHVTSLAPFSTV